MKSPSWSFAAFLRLNRIRLAILVATLLIALAGLRWMSLENKATFVGGLNPSGTRCLTYNYDYMQTRNVTAHVRDVSSGNIIHDLSTLPIRFGNSITWIDDETIVAIVEDRNKYDQRTLAAGQPVDQRIRALTIRLDEDLTVLDEKEVGRAEALRPIGDGQMAFIVIKNGEEHYLEVCKAPIVGDGQGDEVEVLARIEFGSGEEAYAYRTWGSEANTFLIDVQPGSTNPNGDFVFTDGKSPALIVVNQQTGELLRNVRGGYQPIQGTNDFVAKNTGAGVDVCRAENVEEVVATFPSDNGGQQYVLEFDEKRQVISERTSSMMLKVIDVVQGDTPRTRVFALPKTPAFTLAGDNLFVSSDGKLERLNLVSGRRTPLANVRPFIRTLAAVSVVGVPLLVVLAAFALACSPTKAVFFDMAFMCALIAVVFMVWGQTETMRRGFFLSMTQAFLGAALTVFLVWVSTTKSIFGVGIPLATIAIAASVVLYMKAWPGSGGAMIDILVGGTSLIVFQSIGHILFRNFVGRIACHDVAPALQMQFSVRQVGVITAAAAFLFASVRFVRFGEAQVPLAVIFWIVLFGAVYAICIFWSEWCVFRFKNRLTSFVAAFLGTIAMLGLLHLFNWKTNWNPNFRGSFALQTYAQPVLTVLVVWMTLQIARLAGYQLHVRSAAPSY